MKLFTMKVREDDLEKYKAFAKSKGLPLSTLIKMLLEDQPLPKDQPVEKNRRFKKVDPDLLFQIAQIGNNLNQIARRVNSGERIEILSTLRRIEIQLDELIEKC